MLHARAYRQAASMKLKRNVVEAKVYNELKRKYAAEGTKTTEAQLRNEVLTHPAYLTVAHALIEADEELDRCNQAIEAMRQKRDMMVQTAKQRATEMSTSPSFSDAKEFAASRNR